ncbi:hypothetical protein GMES_1865 [Paraglaciecola mesophila KMM 241]|uniref:Uncharacterized protein n=1 Tax=Paraglaciecola mesophila KMM 241 TaxID=1128912 RepID=K6YJI8_9ALTE|nr:hypothetical protein GMES_1865 [Paraglaciecola mesophila KMM 241]
MVSLASNTFLHFAEQYRHLFWAYNGILSPTLKLYDFSC